LVAKIGTDSQKKNVKFHVNRTDENSFTVIHTLGEVSYNINGWAKLNGVSFLTPLSSENQLINSWIESGSSTDKSKITTNIIQFTESLNQLMTGLESTKPQTIFSFVPNHNKSPDGDLNVILAQVREQHPWDSIRCRRRFRGAINN